MQSSSQLRYAARNIENIVLILSFRLQYEKSAHVESLYMQYMFRSLQSNQTLQFRCVTYCIAGAAGINHVSAISWSPCRMKHCKVLLSSYV